MIQLLLIVCRLKQVYYVGIDLKDALENPGGESDLSFGKEMCYKFLIM